MKKSLLLVVLLLPAFALSPKAAAHILADSGKVSAVLHVDPDDNPVPGQPANLYFIFDVSDNFQLSKCACSLGISQGGKGIYYAPLNSTKDSQPTIYSAVAPYTFPAAGQYQIQLNGQPKSGADFKKFNLSWNFKVSAASISEPSTTTTFIKYFGSILLVFLALGGLIYFLA